MENWEDYIYVYHDIPKTNKMARDNCKCKPRCKTYYKFESVNKTICNTRAETFMYNLISKVKEVPNLQEGSGKLGWTMKETYYLRDWVENNIIRHGDYRRIGNILGKSRENVKNKVQYMERNGQLKRKWE